MPVRKPPFATIEYDWQRENSVSELAATVKHGGFG